MTNNNPGYSLDEKSSYNFKFTGTPSSISRYLRNIAGYSVIRKISYN